jgi:hypothetical protein
MARSQNQVAGTPRPGNMVFVIAPGGMEGVVLRMFWFNVTDYIDKYLFCCGKCCGGAETVLM